jgi:FkbM family methyltransferase
MHGTYIGRGRMLIHLAYGGMLVVSSEDYVMMPILTCVGATEPALTHFFASQLKPGDTVVDVGAHVGYFTVLAARLVGETGRIVSFEANPKTFDLLKDNLAINWLTDHDITVRNEAAYSDNVPITFHASAKFAGESSLHKYPTRENRIDDEITPIEVPGVRLDDVLASEPTIDLLKIDIEGGEYHGFQGMMGLIQKMRIRRIIFELNSTLLGEDRPRFFSVLRTIRDDHGGVFHLLDDKGAPQPVQLEELEKASFYPYALIQF